MTWRQDHIRGNTAKLGKDAVVAIDALMAENERLRAALESLRRAGHYECDDPWFSCSKHGGYRCGEPEDICDCGADDVNAIIDAALGT